MSNGNASTIVFPLPIEIMDALVSTKDRSETSGDAG